MKSLAIYIGIGAVCHLFIIGSEIDPLNVWTWAWLLGWPIMLFIYFWAVVLVIGIVCAAVVGVLALAGRL